MLAGPWRRAATIRWPPRNRAAIVLNFFRSRRSIAQRLQRLLGRKLGYQLFSVITIKQGLASDLI